MHVGANQGYRLPRLREICPAVSCFLEGSSCTFWPPSLSFLPPTNIASILFLLCRFCTLALLPSRPSVLPRRVEESRARRDAAAHPVLFLLLLLFFIFLLSLSLPLLSSIPPVPLLSLSVCPLPYPRYAFSCLANSEEPRSYRDYVHLECTHHRPSVPLSTTLFSSLRDAVKSLHMKVLKSFRGRQRMAEAAAIRSIYALYVDIESSGARDRRLKHGGTTKRRRRLWCRILQAILYPM